MDFDVGRNRNRKKNLWWIFVILIFMSSQSTGYCFSAKVEKKPSLRVFPGAEGFGTKTIAGRGGKILKVTNLRDDGLGSLRSAINTNGPRIIVFEVSGVINLTKKITVIDPFCTIAGQTAPPPGIFITGAGLSILTHDVFIQHIFVRIGKSAKENEDCIQILGSNAHNIVIDHVSTSWAKDENISTWGGAHDITISNSIISQGAGSSFGMLIGDFTRNVTIIKNLFAFNKERNPLIKGGTSAVLINNYIYNSADSIGGFGIADPEGSGPSFVSFVGNQIEASDENNQIVAIGIDETVKAGTKIFQEYNSSKLAIKKNNFLVSNLPVWDDSVKVEKTNHVKEYVLENSGARPAERDIIDSQVISNIQKKSGYVCLLETDFNNNFKGFGGYRSFDFFGAPYDDDDEDGYTNFEEYLHELAKRVEGKYKKGFFYDIFSGKNYLIFRDTQGCCGEKEKVNGEMIINVLVGNI